MRIRVGAMILQDDRILSLTYHYPSGTVHALPGGNWETGETLASCLVRELAEELGLQIQVGDLRYLGEMTQPDQETPTLHIIFQAEILAGSPQLDPEHTTAASFTWLPLTQLDKALLYPAINEAILQDHAEDTPGARYLGSCNRTLWA